MKGKRLSSRKNKSGSGRVVKVSNRDSQLTRINEHAAGIDIGSTSHFVAVPPASCADPVRQFSVFTRDLYAIADWLENAASPPLPWNRPGSTGCRFMKCSKSAALKSNSLMLARSRMSQGARVMCWIVNGCNNSKAMDCLREPFVRRMRSWSCAAICDSERCLVKSASTHIQHMQKALQQMNLRLDNVVSDITGQTGMRILKAIIAGERDVEKLGAMRDRNCKATAEVIAQSLVGNYRAEHLFSLKQAVELFEFYQQKIRECEQEIEAYLKKLPHKRDDEPPPAGRQTEEEPGEFQCSG